MEYLLFSIQVLSTVVFPNPAGAEMRVSFFCNPAFNLPSKRGRATSFSRGTGAKSLVERRLEVMIIKCVNLVLHNSTVITFSWFTPGMVLNFHATSLGKITT